MRTRPLMWQLFKRYLHRVIAIVVANILRGGALYDPINFKIWEKSGYHITPIHFYYPIPDTRELERTYRGCSQLPGIDLRPAFQLKLLREVFPRFLEEYNTFPTIQSDGRSFYLDNDAFTGTDPHVYYSMIRHFKPKTIIEIGSGHSTLLGIYASQMNRTTRYICVDPWPRGFISAVIPDVEFIYRKVEDLDIEFFMQLQQNDILFVDSSHVVRTAGDVCFIILEVLPRLSKGVIVHFHDIFLPFDYPKDWLIEKHRFWTEQYLLQAYLVENDHVEVLFANHFMSKEYLKEMQEAFPQALWYGGGSFWIRKR